MALVLLSSTAFGHSTDWSQGYTDAEVDALSVVIQERLERGDPEAAVSLAKRFIIDHSEDVLMRQHYGHKKHRLVRGLVNSTAWRGTDTTTQATILALAIKYGPLTARYERELLYLLARTRSLEGMGMLTLLTVARAAHSPQYLTDSIYESTLGFWPQAFPVLGPNRLLGKKGPIDAHELVPLLRDWLARFSHPDELVALVNARTSKAALDALPFLLDLRRDWPAPVSELQANRLRFWLNSKGCEGHLARPGS